MASERASHGHIPYLDEVCPPESDEAPPISVADIAHAIERLEAGRDTGEYAGMRTSDLVVIWRIPPERWDEVQKDPTLVWQLVTPTARA